LIQQTAILIFANSAQKEAERKSFLSKEAFSKLNAQTLKIVRKSGISYFHFSENQQVGDSFGERFTNAIESILNKGFQNIITIGNDTPHLKTKHLLETQKQLEQKDLILGPSKDGGFYLMGIKKEHFNKEVFLKLPWNKSNLRKAVAKVSRVKKLKIDFLELLNDIDKKQDIKYIINSFKTIANGLLKLLLYLVFDVKQIAHQSKIIVLEILFSKPFNKGSPQILKS
jgi:2-phospho-L-lactate guanylyltransferase (CobY/MobA/RfbA family)